MPFIVNAKPIKINSYDDLFIEVKLYEQIKNELDLILTMAILSGYTIGFKEWGRQCVIIDNDVKRFELEFYFDDAKRLTKVRLIWYDVEKSNYTEFGICYNEKKITGYRDKNLMYPFNKLKLLL